MHEGVKPFSKSTQKSFAKMLSQDSSTKSNQSSFDAIDEEYGESELERALALKAKEQKAEEETNDKLSALAIFKYFYSTVLLTFCIAVVHASVITEQTVGVSDNNIPWVAALIFIWFLMVWLAGK